MKKNNSPKQLSATILLVAMLLLVLIPGVSAFEFFPDKDNIEIVKDQPITIGSKQIEYKQLWERYSPVKIDNIFGFGETLWSGAIETHDEICEVDCQSTMEIFLATEGSLIDDVRFYTINGESEKEEPIRNHKLYISQNETQKWKDYSLGEVVNVGNYLVKIEGEKKPSRNVDWQIKVQGKWIEEWATWGGSTDITYDSFDDAGQPANVSKWIVTKVGGALGNNQSQSLLQLDLGFVAGGDYIDLRTNLSSELDLNVNNQNVSMFINETDYTGGDTNGVYNWSLYDETGTEIEIFSQGWSGNVFNVSMDILIDTVTNEANYSLTADGTAHSNGTSDISLLNAGEKWGLVQRITVGNANINTWHTDYLKYNTQNSFMTLNSPGNNAVVNSQNILFNCSATVIGATISNISLWTNQSGTFQEENVTTELSGNNNETTWSHAVGGEGKYLWSCQGTDSDGDPGFASENRTVEVDSASPLVTINAPGTIVDYGYVNKSEILNWSVSDPNLDSLWFNYNQTNISIFGADNSTTFLLEGISNTNLTFYANDTSGNLNITFLSWEYALFEHSQTFNAQTTEGNTEQFLINFTTASSLSVATANLVYNGTSNNAILENTEDKNYIATRNITIPSISADNNLSFLWNIVYTDSSQINTTFRNQSVVVLTLDNCASNTVKFMNLTLVDEESQNIVTPNGNTTNTSIEVALNIYTSDRASLVLNFSNGFNDTNPVEICLNVNLTEDSNYLTDTTVKYESTSRATEHYNLVGFATNNLTIPLEIILYDLLTVDSTEFKIIFTDENFVKVENALIFIERQYVSEDVFKTVELPKTDSNGETVGHFVRNDLVYNIRVIKDGNLIGSFQNIRAFCDDFTIGACVIALEASSASSFGFDYNSATGLIYNSNPVYDSNASTMSFSFATASGTVETVSMNVTRNDVFGNQTLCSTSLTSASGTLVCTVNPSIDDTSLITVVSVDEVASLVSNTSINNTGLGSMGYVAWFFLSLLFIIMMGEHKTGVFFGMLVSYVGALSFGLIERTLFGIGSAGVWMILITIIGIYKLNKEKQE